MVLFFALALPPHAQYTNFKFASLKTKTQLKQIYRAVYSVRYSFLYLPELFRHMHSVPRI